MTIEEISKLSGLNRNTVRKIIRNLEERGIIKRYTLELSKGQKGGFFIIRTADPESIPEETVVAKLALSNGEYMIVCTQDVLDHEIKYKDIHIVRELEFKNPISNIIRVYCDYCGKEIIERPIEVVYKNHTYYACCHNCEKDLRRKLEMGL